MVAGMECQDMSSRGKNCAYAKRFARWLHSEEGIRVNVINTAVGGVTTSGMLPSLPLLLQSLETQPDLILIDFSVNDGQHFQSWKEGVTRRGQTTAPNMVVAAVTEEMILYLRNVTTAMLWMVEGDCHESSQHARLAHEMVANFHSIPFSSYHRAIQAYPGSCDTYLWGRTTHPNWMIHQMFAYMLAYAWTHYGTPRTTLSTPAALQRVAICTQPLFSWSAFDADPSTYQVLSGNWSVYEDRPGKPGLMSNLSNSIVEFRGVKFGDTPRLIISFLRGYEHLGKFTLSVPTHQNGRHVLTFDGLGDLEANPEHRSTQIYVVNMEIGRKEWEPRLGLLGAMGMRIPPFSEHTLHFTVQDRLPPHSKVKIVSILSC